MTTRRDELLSQHPSMTTLPVPMTPAPTRRDELLKVDRRCSSSPGTHAPAPHAPRPTRRRPRQNTSWCPAPFDSPVQLKLAELKTLCAAAGTPTTGTKAVLIERILDPAAHQRKRAKPGCGIKKKRTAKPKYPAREFLGIIGGAFYGEHGLDSDEEDEEDYEYCEGCDERFERGEIDPHNGLCGDCVRRRCGSNQWGRADLHACGRATHPRRALVEAGRPPAPSRRLPLLAPDVRVLGRVRLLRVRGVRGAAEQG